MSRLNEFAAAGYTPFPVVDGRPVVGGIASGMYRHTPWIAERYPDCDVGLACAAYALAHNVEMLTAAGSRAGKNIVAMSGASGTGTLAATSATWIAGIRWTSHNEAIRSEIDTLVKAALGDGPAYVDGDTVTRIARVEQPFSTRRVTPMHLSNEDWKSLTFCPHQLEIMCRGSWIVLRRDAKPTPRVELPSIDSDGAERLISSVETALINRGALPWV